MADLENRHRIAGAHELTPEADVPSGDRYGHWTPTAAAAANAGSIAQMIEVCARHADALAGQVEAAQRAVVTQLEQLDHLASPGCDEAPSLSRALPPGGHLRPCGQLDQALAAGCWVESSLRVIAASMGELHTVLDETALKARAHQPLQGCEDQPAGCRVPTPRAAEQPRPGWGDH